MALCLPRVRYSIRALTTELLQRYNKRQYFWHYHLNGLLKILKERKV